MQIIEMQLEITKKNLQAEQNALALANKKLDGIESEMIMRVQQRDKLIITEKMLKNEAQTALKENIVKAETALRAEMEMRAQVTDLRAKVKAKDIDLKVCYENEFYLKGLNSNL